MQKFKCSICGYVYDPERHFPVDGIKPGTDFEDIPDKCVYPIYSTEKVDFSP